MDRAQNNREELYNTLTHGIALLFFILLTPFLFFPDSSVKPISLWPVFPFFFGILFTYFSSTTYHFVRSPKLKSTFKILDHISIFFLIGGTYTPVIINFVNHPTSTMFLITMWVLILFGAVLKIWFTGKFDNLSTAFYAFLGWMLVFVIVPLVKNTPTDILLWLILGGFFYTLGIYFYKKDHRLYFHSIWHLFVLGGTISHFVAIALIY